MAPEVLRPGTPTRWRMVKVVTTPGQSPPSPVPDPARPRRDTRVRVRRRQPKTFPLAGNRTDPFYEVAWGLGGRATWLWGINRSTWLRRRGVELSLWDAMNSILGSPRHRDPYGFPIHLAALGVLHSWHTVTAEQLAAFVGDGRLAGDNAGPLTMGVAAGLYDIGQLPRSDSGSDTDAATLSVYQLNDDVRRRGVFLDKLSWMQCLAVTGGQGTGVGPRTDRHNILSAELGLRAAELDVVYAVLGERFSRHDQLASARVQMPPRAGARAADLTVVRSDGLRIALEVTSNTSRGFRSKVRASVRLIADSELDEWGPVVIFVLAVPPCGERWQKRRRRLRKVVEREICRAVRDIPGTSFDHSAARIAVVDWTEWFPTPRTATSAFKELAAHRWVPERQAWEQVAFANARSFSFEPTDPVAGLAIIENAKYLGQSPLSLRRDADVNGVARQMLDQYGLGPDSKYPALDLGRGATSHIQLPPVLLGLEPHRPHSAHQANVSLRPAIDGLSASPLDEDRHWPPRTRRAACEVRVTLGHLSVEDVIAYVIRSPSSPIGAVVLKDLLRAQPDGADVRRSLRQLTRAARVLGEDSTIASKTVRWLVDGRSRGRRLAAWRDAGLPRKADPGFPWRHGRLCE